jgi:NAD+ kinase
MTSTPVSSVGIVAKHHLRQAAPHLADISAWLRQRGLRAVFEAATAALCSPCEWPVRDKEQLIQEVDMLLVLGGDGTLLGMADRISEAGLSIPILGVNFGSLGFLTEVTLPELYRSLESAIAGHAHIEERLMLQAVTTRGGVQFARHTALNDAVIAKTARARLVDLSVWVGDEFLTRVKGDGVIVTTPTGSTAYNLAVGGPIMHPAVEGLVVTPIAPHTLTNRPIVIPSSSPVRVKPRIEERDEVFVTFDGQAGHELQAGDEVSVCRAATPLRLIRPSTRGYFEVLREKLKWGEH